MTRGYLDEVEAAYPGLDLLGECRRAKVWLEANPKKLKTYGGMKAFLANWFTKAQNHPGIRYTQTSNGSALPDSVVHPEQADRSQDVGKLNLFGQGR